MLANLVSSLIKHKRVTTTLAKAKAARPVAEKMVTLGKRGTIQARRLVKARLRAHGPTVQLTKEARRRWRQNEDVLRILFEELAPAFKERNGGYTRIVKMDQRQGDAAQRAILEWVEFTAETAAETETKAAEAAKPAETQPETKDETK